MEISVLLNETNVRLKSPYRTPLTLDTIFPIIFATALIFTLPLHFLRNVSHSDYRACAFFGVSLIVVVLELMTSPKITISCEEKDVHFSKWTNSPSCVNSFIVSIKFKEQSTCVFPLQIKVIQIIEHNVFSDMQSRQSRFHDLVKFSRVT